MKIFAAMVLMFLSAFSFGSESLRIGVDPNLKPFVYMDQSGDIAGFDVDIAKAVCEEIKVECKFVPMEWDGLIPALNSKKVDVLVTSMSITEQRERVVDFTRPYYKSPSQLLTRKGTDLLSMKIGVLRGSTDERFAREKLAKGSVSVVAYGNQNEAFMDLQSGRVQSVLGPKIELQEGAIDLLRKGEVIFVGELFTDIDYYGPGIGMAVREGDPLRNLLNNAIAKIRADGTWQRVSDQYFSDDIWPHD